MTPAPLEPGIDGFTVIGLGDSLTGGFGRPLLLSGRLPGSGSIDEIAVSEGVASRHGLRVGQRVPLIALGCVAGCPPEKVGDATIVGIVRLPTDIAGDPSVPGVVIAEPSVLDGRWRSLARLPSWLGVHLNDASDTRSVIADWSTKFVDGEVASSRVSLTMPERAGDRQRNGLLVRGHAVGGRRRPPRHSGRGPSSCWAVVRLLRPGGSRRQRPRTGCGRWDGRRTSNRRRPDRWRPPGNRHITAVPARHQPARRSRHRFPRRCDDHARRWCRCRPDADGADGPVRAEVGQARPGVAAQGEPSLAARLAQGLAVRPVAATGIRFALDRGVGMRRLPVIATTGSGHRGDCARHRRPGRSLESRRPRRHPGTVRAGLGLDRRIRSRRPAP